MAHDIEVIARAFHEAYEQLAPDFSYQTRKASAVPWEDVPESNKSLMCATVAKLIHDGVIARPLTRGSGTYTEIQPVPASTRRSSLKGRSCEIGKS